MVLTIRRSAGPVNQPVSAFLLLINDDHFYQHPCLLRVFVKGHAWLISRVGAQRFDFHAAPIQNVRHPGFLLGGAMWEKQLQSGFHFLQGLKIMFATGPRSPCAILWFLQFSKFKIPAASLSNRLNRRGFYILFLVTTYVLCDVLVYFRGEMASTGKAVG